MKSEGFNNYFTSIKPRHILFIDVVVWVLVSIGFLTGITTLLFVVLA